MKTPSDIGCLLFHGWSSSPSELQGLKKYLEQNHIVVHTPLLPGHGTKPEDLNQVDWRDWLNASETALKKLQRSVRHVFVGGASMGGNLAFLLAQRHAVSGIISMGTPIFIQGKWLGQLLLYICWITGQWYRPFKKHYPKTIREEILAAKEQYWSVSPKSVQDTFTIIDMTRPSLKAITVPTLVMQSTHDHVVQPRSAAYIYEHINARRKKLFWINDAYHVFILDHQKETAFQEIHNFIQSTIAYADRNFH